MHQFSGRQRPKFRRGVQEQFKCFLSVRILITLNYLILAFDFETFVANLFPSIHKQNVTAVELAADPLATATSAKTEVSSSMSLPSNILLYETDSKFHARLAAHRLLSPDKIHKFWKLFQISWSLCRSVSIRNIYYYEHRCPRFDWTALQVVRTSFLGPRPRFYPPPGSIWSVYTAKWHQTQLPFLCRRLNYFITIKTRITKLS